MPNKFSKPIGSSLSGQFLEARASSPPKVGASVANSVSDFRKSAIASEIEQGKFIEGTGAKQYTNGLTPASTATFLVKEAQVSNSSAGGYRGASGNAIKQTPEIYSTLIAISGMISLYAKNMVEFKVALEQGVSRKLLSRRQNKILDLIKEKLTNREIGEELGYSESTIRQETMRIYRILGVGNRRGASTFKFIED